ncbi:hypothetical protein [Halorubellus salinus]|uniref:hypothetical protein n=1 Tax=Halorubellus salinus TaxID=755309 RepID=UPI001D098A69|nr:hypothetical protein [Halorubellus salinus]
MSDEYGSQLFVVTHQRRNVHPMPRVHEYARGLLVEHALELQEHRLVSGPMIRALKSDLHVIDLESEGNRVNPKRW